MNPTIRAPALLLGPLALAALVATGCRSSPTPPGPTSPMAEDCLEGPIDVAGRGLETGAEGVETGVETGASAVKQGVKAAGGFVVDGPQGAENEWNEQKEDTKGEAREGAAETRGAARPPCR